MGTGGMGGAEGQRFSQGWQFRSSIDPEELFRKIFGDAGFRSGGFGTEFEDFAESSFGFGAAQEVRNTSHVQVVHMLHFNACYGVHTFKPVSKKL